MRSILRPLLGALVGIAAQSHAASAYATESQYVSATAGAAFDADSIHVALLEARTEVLEHLSLAAAVAYLDFGGSHSEGQLRLMALGSWSVQQWSIENRHLLSFSTECIERYRVRLRAVRSGLLGLSSLSLRAFDEAFYDFDQEQLIRNNLALGMGLQLNPALTAELYRVWEGNREVPDNRYVLGLVTFRF